MERNRKGRRREGGGEESEEGGKEVGLILILNFQ